MQNPFGSRTDPKLQALIDDVVYRMNEVTVASDDYPKLLTQLERLNKLKAETSRPPISRDTLVMVGGNVLIAFGMIAYEHAHVITSKALGRMSSPGSMY